MEPEKRRRRVSWHSAFCVLHYAFPDSLCVPAPLRENNCFHKRGSHGETDPACHFRSDSALKDGYLYITKTRMKTVISSTEAARHLGDLLARVKHAGESFVLTKSEKPLARLVPFGPPVRATGEAIMGALAGLPHDPDFADDLERVNRMDRIPADPWA